MHSRTFSLFAIGFSVFLPPFLFAQSPSKPALPNPWTKQANFSGGVAEKGVAFVIGDYGYAGMGTDNAGFRKDLWRYSFINNNWARVEDFPAQPRISAASFSIGTRGYVCGGLSGVENSKQPLKDFWEYDPEKNSWMQKADLGGDPRSAAVGFSIGGKGYVTLGSGNTAFYNDLWEYDPGANKWVRKADFPEGGKADASVFVIGKEAYVLFGQSKELFPSKKLSWRYSPEKNEWRAFAEFPDSPRTGVITFSHANKGYAIGGTSGALKRFEELWEYDAAKDKWRELADVPFGTCAYGFAFMSGNRAFVCPGKAKSGSGAEVWKYELVEPPPSGTLIIGGSLLLGDERIPLAGVEVMITNTKGEVIKSAFTNLFGSFLFTNLPEKEDLIFTFNANDPGWKDEKFILVNKKNEAVAVLNKGNQFKFYLNSASKNKIQLIKLENTNLRMNMRGKLVLDDKKKTPLGDIGVSLMNEDEEVMQAGVTNEKGVFTFDYLPVDSTVYLSVDEKMVKKLSKGEKILLLDDGDNLVSKTAAAHPEFALTTLPPEKNPLAKVYMEDAWVPLLSDKKNAEMKVVEPVYFDVGKSDILPEAKAILNKAVALLKSNAAFTIEIQAHTDARGDEKKNQELSEQRAKAAMDYMISKGVPAGQITATGYGETKLLNKCKDGVKCSEEEHALNRRMEFIIKRK